MEHYSYDWRIVAAAPNRYQDEMDASFIATQVVQYGKSRGWAAPTDPYSAKLAQQIEATLSKFNIGIDASGTWAYKPGGSHVFR